MKMTSITKTTMSLAALAAFAGVANAATIISTFDSDLESWTNGGTEGAVFSQVSPGGNPAGYLQAASVQASTVLIAPTAFLGDLSAYDAGTFSWDGIALDTGAGGQPGSYAYGGIVITGNGTTAYSPFISSGDKPTTASWSSYSQRR